MRRHLADLHAGPGLTAGFDIYPIARQTERPCCGNPLTGVVVHRSALRCHPSSRFFAPHAAVGDTRPGLSCAPPARVRLPVPGRRRLDPGQTASRYWLSRALSSSTIRIPGRRMSYSAWPRQNQPGAVFTARAGAGSRHRLLRRGRCRAPSGVGLRGTVPVRARIQLPVRRVQVNASTLKSLDGGGRRTRRELLCVTAVNAARLSLRSPRSKPPGVLFAG